MKLLNSEKTLERAVNKRKYLTHYVACFFDPPVSKKYKFSTIYMADVISATSLA